MIRGSGRESKDGSAKNTRPRSDYHGDSGAQEFLLGMLIAASAIAVAIWASFVL